MKKYSQRNFAFCILHFVLCGFMFLGCIVATKKTVITPEIGGFFKGKYKVDPYLKTHMPRTVALLPFVDRSKSKEGIEAVRRAFYNHFSALRVLALLSSWWL